MEWETTLQKSAWFILNTIILGSALYAYTIGVRSINDPQTIYITIISATVLLVLYTYLVLLADRISQTLSNIVTNVESVEKSVNNISDELSEDKK